MSRFTASDAIAAVRAIGILPAAALASGPSAGWLIATFALEPCGQQELLRATTRQALSGGVPSGLQLYAIRQILTVNP